MKHYFIAVDLGATSGRIILGTWTDQVLETEEIHRFANRIIEVNGHSFWDIYALYQHIIDGLKLVAERGLTITSIGIDTWGVDFAFFGEDGMLLRQPYSYRDPQTTDVPEKYFRRVPKDLVYDLTGIQVMNFNSLFQLDTLRQRDDSALKAVNKILFMPDALSYLLTGEMVTEYTIASTSQLLHARTRRFASELLHSLGLSESHFGRMVKPGEQVGILSKPVQRLTGLGEVPVIAVAEHDTASAVAAVPAENANFAYLSSGTWSLMGLEVQSPVITDETKRLNLTNEGGVEGTIRLLKNICGMWLLERCRTQWTDASYEQLVDEAAHAEPFRSLINPDAEVFANPTDMILAIKDFCRQSGQPVPETRGQLVRCIFESLALRYREVMDDLSRLAEHPIDVLHVIGGGSKNDLLNQFTANATGLTVVSGPTEATAIGNMMMQAIAAGKGANVSEMRQQVRQSVSLKTFQPTDTAQWEHGYDTYKHRMNKI